MQERSVGGVERCPAPSGEWVDRVASVPGDGGPAGRLGLVGPTLCDEEVVAGRHPTTQFVLVAVEDRSDPTHPDGDHTGPVTRGVLEPIEWRGPMA